MIVEHGLQSFTMDGLARAAGVSAQLVYNYFPSRQALLEAELIAAGATAKATES